MKDVIKMKRILAIILVLCTLCLYSCTIFAKSSTTDIGKYGRYDRCVGDHETCFFPELDERIMSDFGYSYKADCIIDCAHEIFLEFIIESEDEFAYFVKEHTDSIKKQNNDAQVRQFEYDKSFTEVVIEDIVSTRYSEEGALVIDFAYVRKLLYNEETNSIVFVNLYVIDYWELENSAYISRFNIDLKALT